jgi:hypothetical protein
VHVLLRVKKSAARSIVIGLSGQRRGLVFDPSALLKQHEEYCGPTCYDISSTEFATLALATAKKKEWTRPNPDVTIYIPLLAVEAFENKYGICSERNAHQDGKKEKGNEMGSDMTIDLCQSKRHFTPLDEP